MENLVSHCSGVSSTRLNNFGAFCKSGYSPVYAGFVSSKPYCNWGSGRKSDLVFWKQCSLAKIRCKVQTQCICAKLRNSSYFHPEFHAEFLVFVVFSKSARQIAHVWRVACANWGMYVVKKGLEARHQTGHGRSQWRFCLHNWLPGL